jgi:hypothetical protein
MDKICGMLLSSLLLLAIQMYHIRLSYILLGPTLCICSLMLLNAENGEWFWNRYHVSYFPDKAHKVKRANKFETPGLETDIHGTITAAKVPLVSLIEDTPKLRARCLNTSEKWKDTDFRQLNVEKGCSSKNE